MSTSRSDLTFSSYPQPGNPQQRATSPATSNPSPIDPAAATASACPPFGLPPPGLGGTAKMATSRSGNGSPSHEVAASSRLFSKRAREIQAQEGIAGMPINLWAGPPTSGNSTPLRENIPESPTDGFPDFAQLPSNSDFLPLPAGRRARAGTVPSRFSPGGAGNGGLPSLLALGSGAGPVSKTSRPTPTQTPFKSPSPSLESQPDAGVATASSSTLLSRLRAGSMPQRSPFSQTPSSISPFGPSIFSSWNPTTRERGSTLASIASLGSNVPSSPAQSTYSREGTAETDVHMRTLDYLGLVETPQPPRATLATPYMPNLADFTRSASRFRSYSVNNKDKYADEDEDDAYDTSGIVNLETQYAAALQDQIAATNAAIHNHNLAVQAFANQAAANRPRAQTAGVLDAPGSRSLRGYFPTPSRLDSNLMASDIQLPEEKDFDDQLPQAVAAMSLGRSNSRSNNPSNAAAAAAAAATLLSADEPTLEGPTSALWLGSIPTSTTTSTLTELFKPYGFILSSRVLTLKSCGFVNFERVDSAIAARASLNGKEIFPGAGPVRINFAKPPSSSNTPGHDGAFPSPSPDPFADGKTAASLGHVPSGQAGAASTHAGGPDVAGSISGVSGAVASGALGSQTIPPAVTTPAALSEVTNDMVHIVRQFGASTDDIYRISGSLQQAGSYTSFVDEIPPVPEPSSTRAYDAPKLRDIRKRIDNQSLSQADIEQIAYDMLPEIAELASDYLGNTVVQKLFEHCSDDVRDAMLVEIAPHMAEIGVHKNGTWAAQKIIDVCKTPQQMATLVEHIQPYTVPLFLDQYGNYVLQCCLKFGVPYTNFIFESMVSRLWDIAQGRFGARAMRACLESHHAGKDQQRMVAAAISLNSVQLALNTNGTLLLTWLLDTCTFPQRRTVLAPRLVPYLVHLGTHKVAYLTVLKVFSQKQEAEARDTILKALFSTQNDHVLEAILNDNSCGATLMYKVITSPCIEENVRSQVVDSVKTVLVRIQAQPSQGYKRLMDEVGLSTRSSGGNGAASGSGGAGSSRDHSANNDKQRPSSRQAGHHPLHPHHHNPQQAPIQGHHPYAHHQGTDPQKQRTSPHGGQTSFNGGGGVPGPYFSSSPNPPPGYESGFALPRGDGGAVEAGMQPLAPFHPYNGPGGLVYGIPGQSAPPVSMQQLPYQPGVVLGRGGPNMPGFYPPPMQAGYNGFTGASAPPSLMAMPSGNGVVQPQYVPAFGMGPAYGYGGAPPPPFVPDQQHMGGGGRSQPGRSPRQESGPGQYR